MKFLCWSGELILGKSHRQERGVRCSVREGRDWSEDFTERVDSNSCFSFSKYYILKDQYLGESGEEAS